MTQAHVNPIQRHIIEDLLGTPYEALDCFQLIREIFRRDAGILLPDDTNAMALLFGEAWYWKDGVSLDEIIQPYDVLLMATKAHGIGTHLAIVVDDGMTFLHTRERLGTCQEPTQRWKSRIVQVLRYRQGF